MRPFRPIIFSLSLLILFLTPLCRAAYGDEPSVAVKARDNNILEYNSYDDALTIEVEDYPLKRLLGRISLLTGVEIFVESSIEKSLSVSISGERLEAALGRLLRGFNYTFSYKRGGEEGGGLMLELTVLPKSKGSQGVLLRAVSIEAEFLARESERRGGEALPPGVSEGYLETEVAQEVGESIDKGTEEMTVRDLLNERWEVRTSRMDPEKRSGYESWAEARSEKVEAERAQLDLRRSGMEARVGERVAEEGGRLEALKESNPGFYRAHMERRMEVLREVEAGRLP